MDTRAKRTHSTLLQAGTVEGNRTINVDLREINVGELFTRVRAQFSWYDSAKPRTFSQGQQVLPSCQAREQVLKNSQNVYGDVLFLQILML